MFLRVDPSECLGPAVRCERCGAVSRLRLDGDRVVCRSFLEGGRCDSYDDVPSAVFVSER